MLRSLIDFLIPPECRLCGSSLAEGEEDLCALCAAGLARTGYHKDPDNPMAMRFAGRFPFVRATGFFYYAHDSGISHLIHDFKYRGAERLAYRLGRLVADELSISGFFDDIELIIPVPLHWKRRLGRGYNQSECIAKGVGDVTGIAVSRALKAKRSHKSQTRLAGNDRLKNADGVYIFNGRGIPEDIRILLVDDVCTTGATLTSAADAVLSALPTARISLLTLAVTI